jgi:hypothetical protein
VTQINENTVSLVLQFTCKAIAHFLKEGVPVSLDFSLTTNEALLFNSDKSEFIHK